MFVQCKYVTTFLYKVLELSHVMDNVLKKCYVLLLCWAGGGVEDGGSVLVPCLD